MSAKSAWKYGALAATFALTLVVFLQKDSRPDFSDFKVYWLAGTKAAVHHTVYDVQGHYQYKYSPFVALLWAIPSTLLPGQRYHWTWLHYAACGCGFALLWWLLARVIDPARAFAWWLFMWIVFGVALRDELKLGQENLWPFLLVLPAWFAGSRERTARGFDAAGFMIGVAWALAIQWKLYALVLAPLWLLRRRWQVFIGAIVAEVVTLLGVLSVVHGPSFAIAENVRWARSLTASSEELLISQFNVSALGCFGKWGRMLGFHGGLGIGSYLAWLALALAWFAVLVWAEREAVRRDAAFLRFWSSSWAWAGIVLLNPLVWPYWLMLCMPLFLAYVSENVARPFDPVFVAVTAAFVVANWLQNMHVVHMGLSFVVVVVWMFDAQRRARARDGAQLAKLSQMPLSRNLRPRPS